uniref:hypothetical protein n=1 Tax=Agathobacter sp. TaxID=2021311 RepID=UPI0040560606
MNIETTIARNIRAADDGAKYDAACKRLLSEKIILAWIMKHCLEEYKDSDVNEIAEKYIEGTPQVAGAAVLPDETNATLIHGANTEDSTITEGTITYDIRFFASVPISKEKIRLIVNVEAQNDFYPGYPLIKRGLYYCSRMISSQYGTEFTDSHYEKIKKVYSIWICPNPPKKWQNSITRYSVKEENLIGNVKEKKENYDMMTAVMVFLGGSEKDNYAGVLKLLDVLLSTETNPQEKKQILEEDFQIQMTQKLESEVSVMCNLSKGVMEKAMEQGMEQGIKQGIKQGMKQGMEQGIKQGMAHSIANLMKTMKLSLEEAMNALDIPEAEQAEYIEMLKKE